MIKGMPIKLIISFITIVLLASIFYIPQSHAIGDIMGEGKGFLEASKNENSVINDTVLKDASDYIYNTLLAMAIIIAVIVAMALGIQFMYAAADEKAKIKEALMPFVVGCIIVFSSFTIWKVFIDIGQSSEDSIVGISVEPPKDIANNDKDNVKDDNHNNNEVENKFEKWYEYLINDEQYFENGEFIPDEGEEKAKSWSKKEWREFYNYVMEKYGGIYEFDRHLKEYIESKY